MNRYARRRPPCSVELPFPHFIARSVPTRRTPRPGKRKALPPDAGTACRDGPPFSPHSPETGAIHAESLTFSGASAGRTKRGQGVEAAFAPVRRATARASAGARARNACRERANVVDAFFSERQKHGNVQKRWRGLMRRSSAAGPRDFVSCRACRMGFFASSGAERQAGYDCSSPCKSRRERSRNRSGRGRSSAPRLQTPAEVGMDPESMPAFSASTLPFSSFSFSSLPDRTSGSF